MILFQNSEGLWARAITAASFIRCIMWERGICSQHIYFQAFNAAILVAFIIGGYLSLHV